MGLFLIAYSGIEQPIFSLHRPLAKPGVSKIFVTGTPLTVIMYKIYGFWQKFRVFEGHPNGILKKKQTMPVFLIAYSGIEQPIFSLYRTLAKPGVSEIFWTGTSLTEIMYRIYGFWRKFRVFEGHPNGILKKKTDNGSIFPTTFSYRTAHFFNL